MTAARLDRRQIRAAREHARRMSGAMADNRWVFAPDPETGVAELVRVRELADRACVGQQVEAILVQVGEVSR